MIVKFAPRDHITLFTMSRVALTLCDGKSLITIDRHGRVRIYNDPSYEASQRLNMAVQSILAKASHIKMQAYQDGWTITWPEAVKR